MKVDLLNGGRGRLRLFLLLAAILITVACAFSEDVDTYPTPKSCDEPNPYYEVRFEDPVLEDQIIELLGLADKHPTHADLCQLHLITFNDCGITHLGGLQFATGLLTINLRFNEIEDVGPLSVLPEVTSIKLSYNDIEDISTLRHLAGLQELELAYNRIVNIDAVVGMERIGRLDLSYNLIEDVRPLLLCPGLENGGFVDLTGNPLNEDSLTRYIPELLLREVGVSY